MIRTTSAIVAVLAVATLGALAEQRTYLSKDFPNDVPCELFRRDDNGTWHLGDGVIIDTGPFKINLWSRTRNTAEGKLMEARCGSN